jgi:hypothetical protein
MIPARRDGMLTDIPLVIQILKSVYMIPSLIRLDGISATDTGIPPKRDEKLQYKRFIPPSRDEKFPYKHFIPARRDDFFPFEHA